MIQVPLSICLISILATSIATFAIMADGQEKPRKSGEISGNGWAIIDSEFVEF